jgi:NAD(P)-dependent dehydrogenase (short-subunit alcohol dehydrogenase family)
MPRSNEQEHVPQVENQWYDDWIKDVPDLTERVAVVTGCNSGTGFWAASALAGKGCTVVMACRSVEKADRAKKDILETYPQANLEVIQMDNMDLSSVRSFAKTFNAKYDRLDYLLNNAGIMAQPLIKSKDGYDIQFQTNHLAHFLLTKLLWNKLVASPGQGRVVNHSSSAHHFGSPIFDKDRMDDPTYAWGWFGVNVLMVRVFFPLMGANPMDRWLRYGVSKLCNVLMMRSLQRKIEGANLTDKVIAVACHPGYASTGLQYAAAEAMSNWQRMNERNAQSAADGSLPLLMATVGASVENGDYLGPSLGMEMKGPPKKAKVGGNGNNAEMAKELWEYSEECLGEKFEVWTTANVGCKTCKPT